MRFRRYLINRIVIAVMLGAVTTVAVAWLTVVLRTNHYVLHRSDGQHDAKDVVTSFDLHETLLWSTTATIQIKPLLNVTEVTRGSRNLDALPTWSGALDASLSFRNDRDGLAEHSMIEFASGWPLRAMLTVQLVTYDDSIPITLSGLPLDSLPKGGQVRRGARARALPLRIIPHGFAVNTAIAAALWWLLLFAFPTTRRYLRTRRGACLRCGYGPLASPDARCPECGSIRGERVQR